MRKAKLLFAVTVVPIALALVLAVLEAERPPDWQAELNQYAAYIRRVASRRTGVLEIDRARRPWAFSADMSIAVYGDSVHYRTDYGYTHTRRCEAVAVPAPRSVVRASGTTVRRHRIRPGG
jgi:hypothetical protein